MEPDQIPEELWKKLFQVEKGSNVSTKLFQLHNEDKPIAIFAGKREYEVTVKKASEVGDNFASDVYRIVISSSNLCSKEVSTFAKPELGDRSPFDFMFDYLPDDGSERILVVEDLKPKGFVMQPKAQGHSLDSVKKTLVALAHWHAVGCVILKKLGSPPPGMSFFLEKTVYDQNTGMFEEFIETLKTVLEKAGEMELAQRLVDLSPRIKEEMDQTKPGSQGVLETIIHGDFWNNNILYKLSEDGKVEDLAMIDFQIARIGHPCDDLGFYLFGNTTAEFRTEHLSEVLHLYYTEVKQVLLELGYDVEEDLKYSERIFLEEWKDRLLRMFMFGIIVTASVMSKKDDVKASLDKGEDLIEQLAQMISSVSDERQREELKKQIQEKGKQENFMSNPELLSKNEAFVGRFVDLVRELLPQVDP